MDVIMTAKLTKMPRFRIARTGFDLDILRLRDRASVYFQFEEAGHVFDKIEAIVSRAVQYNLATDDGVDRFCADYEELMAPI